jgi:hypothetical protein
MFHSGDGLYFEKLPDAGVRILKRSGNDEDSPVIFDHVLDRVQWDIVVAGIKHGFNVEAAVVRQPDLPPIVD